MRLLLLFALAVSIIGQVLPLGSIPHAAAALTVDSQMPSGTCVTTAASPWTWSFTNTAGTVIYLFFEAGVSMTLSSTATATYAGTAMVQLGNVSPRQNTSSPFDPRNQMFLFRLTSPATGANNFVITWTNGGGAPAIGCAISFRGNNASPDSGLAATNFYGGTTGTVSTLLTTPTTVGNTVLQATCYGDAPKSTQSGTVSSFREVDNSSFCDNQSLQFQASAASSTTTTQTSSVATSWATIGIEVRAASNPANTITALPNTCVGDQNGAVSGSVSCTWSPSAPAAGSSLVCGGTTFNGGSAVTGLSISDGTVFTNSQAARDYTSGGNRWIILSYRFNILATAPSTVTLTITGTDAFANITCNAFRDTGTPTADGVCTFGTTSTATTGIGCTSAITTTGTDYVTGLIGIAGTFPQIPALSGWSQGAGVKGTLTELQFQGAAGSINPSFTVQTGQPGGINGFAIKP